MNTLDNITCIIILRALYLYRLLEKGFIVRKAKNKNTFQLTKVNLKK